MGGVNIMLHLFFLSPSQKCCTASPRDLDSSPITDEPAYSQLLDMSPYMLTMAKVQSTWSYQLLAGVS